MSESAEPPAATMTAPATAASTPPSPGRDRGLPASRVGGATPPVDASSLHASDPTRVGGYRLVARLGAGGMADVFYSLTATGQPVAVKVFRPAGGGAAAYHREYRLARAAGADCTAPALGCGTSSAASYLVTAYLPGYRCGNTLLSGSTREKWLWQFGAALARVLTALHARGVVHCDVKPSNLLVRGHDVRVIDFGISRYVDEPPLADRTIQCSPGWAAPEQLHVGPPTSAVDVFAWGCVLAYLAGGVRPFGSRDDQDWYERVQAAEPNLSNLPPELGEVVRWSLARTPRDRPSAATLAMTCQALASARG